MTSRETWQKRTVRWWRLRREEALTGAGILSTTIASFLLGRDLAGVLVDRMHAGTLAGVLEQLGFLAIAASLLYGNLVYQVARLGHLQRRRLLEPVAEAELEAIYEETVTPPLALLVPSYREEPRLIRQTLLSVALQDYPRRRVVLLIDDPPEPSDAEAAALLHAARRLPKEIGTLLAKPARRFARELADFSLRAQGGDLDLREETLRIAALYAEAAAWLEAQAANETEADHTDRHFVELVFREPARAHLARTVALEAAVSEGMLPDARRLRREYRRLAALFRVELTSFERKRFVNLSHEPNKAMNLNAYIGLLGGRFRKEAHPDGRHLVPASDRRASLHFPDAEFLVTLDADSLLVSRYALRLVYELRRPGNERVAVAQTPYTAIPRATRLLERVAGATTDVQYVIHQGFTRHGATFWVGANAVLRRSAIATLRKTRRERGYEVPCFIQDRTLIEDTDSTIDLVARRWTLHNHPERLAYSATPPDFGALLIQRRRWANGGLLVLPKLLGTLIRGPWRLGKLAEGWMRCHYLVSIACVNVSLLALLLHPFEHSMREWWLPVASLPYFVLYARDLAWCGYPRLDLFRVYALNLLLLPVNLAGVLKSLGQAVTGRKLPFGRTPKVQSRTAVTPSCLLAHGVLFALLVWGVGVDLERGRWLHALLLIANGGILLYAFVRFIGLRESVEDLRVQLLGRSARDARAGLGAAESAARWVFGAVGAGCLAVLAFGLWRFDESFRSPDLVFGWFALPLLGLVLSAAFALLPGSGRLALASTLTTVALLEAGVSLGDAWRASRVETVLARDYYQPDPALGYGPKPGIHTRASKRIDGTTLYDVEYQIDEKGRRITPVENLALRDRFLLFFGCSFAFGEGVEGDETLPAFAARGAPRYVPYNYAFHGYGPNQFLSKLESGTLRGEVREAEGVLVYVLIGAHASRAIGSMLVVSSWAHDAPHYTLDAAGKPVRSGTFTTGRPFTSLAYALLGQSHVARFLHLDVPPVVTDEHLALTARLLARSAELIRESFGPQRFVVVAYPEHWPSAIAGRLAGALAREGIEVLDYSSLFGADRDAYFFREDRHPNARAHRAVAERLVADLGLGEGAGGADLVGIQAAGPPR